MNFYSYCPSPLGELTLLASDQGLRGVYFTEHRHFTGLQQASHQPEARHLQQTIRQLQEYFEGQRQSFDLTLDLAQGTEFQQKVWRALQQIPFAATCSYAQLAVQIGSAKAVRAVGAANGRNPWSIIIPCHRVIASSGALTGYAGGLHRKQMLLKFEQDQLNSR